MSNVHTEAKFGDSYFLFGYFLFMRRLVPFTWGVGALQVLKTISVTIIAVYDSRTLCAYFACQLKSLETPALTQSRFTEMPIRVALKCLRRINHTI